MNATHGRPNAESTVSSLSDSGRRRRKAPARLPVVPLEEPPAAAVALEAEQLSTAAQIVAAASAGYFDAAGERHEVIKRLDAITAIIDERFRFDPDSDGACAAILLAELREMIPGSTGDAVACCTCGGLGRAIALEAGSLVWVWPGLTAAGAIVHPFRVVQARRVGDMPPWLCPDHEADRDRRKPPLVTRPLVAAGRVELERRASR